MINDSRLTICILGSFFGLVPHTVTKGLKLGNHNHVLWPPVRIVDDVLTLSVQHFASIEDIVLRHLFLAFLLERASASRGSHCLLGSHGSFWRHVPNQGLGLVVVCVGLDLWSLLTYRWNIVGPFFSRS